MRRHLPATLLVIMLGCGLGFLVAAPTARAAVVPVGTAFTGVPFVIEGDLVLETDGLVDVIRDVADADHPELIGWLDHSQEGYFGELSHDAGLLLAVHGAAPWGFHIVDVDTPSAPEILHVSSSDRHESGWIRDGAIWLASETFALVYDVDDPSSPTFAAFVPLGAQTGSRWFSALDDVLYCRDGGATLRGLDVTTPLAPVDLGTIDLDATRVHALLAGDGVLHALVGATAPAGQETVSLVTLAPDAPLDLQVTSTHVLATGSDPGPLTMAREGRLLLATDGFGTVHAFDLAAPAAPERGYTLAAAADRLAVSASQVFVMQDATLDLRERRGPGDVPPLRVSRTMLPRYRTVIGSGPVVYAQRYEDSSVLVPVDFTNPRVPRHGEPLDLGFGSDLTYADGLLVVTDGSERLDLWDLGDPDGVRWLRSLDDVSRLGGGHLGDGVLALAGFDGVGTILYDVSDPERPVRGGGIATAFPRAVGDGLLITGGGSRPDLWDVSDVHRPRRLAEFATDGSALASALGRGHAFLVVERLVDDVTVRSYDLADPAAPVEVSRVAVGDLVTRLYRHGARLYAQGFHTTHVIDATDPAALAPVGSFDTWGETGRALAFFDDITINSGLLISLRDEGYHATAVPERRAPASATLALPHPNPFNPGTTLAFSVARPGRYSLTVHDVRGRTVAVLVAGRLAAGEHTATWQGRDRSGRPVASGRYVARLEGPGVDVARPLTLVK